MLVLCWPLLAAHLARKPDDLLALRAGTRPDGVADDLAPLFACPVAVRFAGGSTASSLPRPTCAPSRRRPREPAPRLLDALHEEQPFGFRGLLLDVGRTRRPDLPVLRPCRHEAAVHGDPGRGRGLRRHAGHRYALLVDLPGATGRRCRPWSGSPCLKTSGWSSTPRRARARCAACAATRARVFPAPRAGARSAGVDGRARTSTRPRSADNELVAVIGRDVRRRGRTFLESMSCAWSIRVTPSTRGMPGRPTLRRDPSSAAGKSRLVEKHHVPAGSPAQPGTVDPKLGR